MLAALLLSAFAVYGFFSLLLALTERCSDALAVKGKGDETPRALSRRCRLIRRGGREVVIILDDEIPSDEIFSLGYAVYLRVSGEKGDRRDGV